MRMSKILRAAVLLTPLLAAACGPMYSTTYHYVPPSDWRGKACVQDALDAKQACESRAERRREHCERENQEHAERAFRQYERERRAAKLPVKKSVYDFKSYSCPSSYSNDERCEASYRSAFQNCGGEVIPQRECVAFCDQQQRRP